MHLDEAADEQLLAAAKQIGLQEGAERGREDQHGSGCHTGLSQRPNDTAEQLHPVRVKVVGGFDEPRIQPL